MSKPTVKTQSRRPSFRRRMLFRLLAVLIGLSPFLISELVLTALDVGRPSELQDPYIGFEGVRPLFVLDSQTGMRRIPSERLEFFRPQSFPAEKPAGAFRIFCLGGSTVQGRPYAVETSFTTWLRLSLEAAQPDRHWEVINCGGVSYASYRLAPILEEVLDYQPDLIVLYTGHNEFLEDRTYRSMKEAPAALTKAHGLLSASRTYCVLRSGWLWMSGKSNPTGDKLPTEVQARLDYQGGLAQYHRDDAWRASIVEHYRYNLLRMIALCRQRGVPVVLVNPVSNLKDSPPFKYDSDDRLTTEQLEKFESLWQAARQEGVDPQREIELIRQALAIDPRHAGARFHLGKCYQAAGRWQQARAEFLLAKEEDVCPLRMIQPLHDALHEVANRTHAPLVDARRLFQQRSEGNIVGEELMVDHVHPSIAGHQQIAGLLMDELVRQNLVKATSDWQPRRDALFRKHFQSLDAVYFQRGKQRLKGLQRWTQGRAMKIRPRPVQPSR